MRHTIVNVEGEPKIQRSDLFVDWIWEDCSFDSLSFKAGVRITVRYSRTGVDGMGEPMLPFTV